MTGAGRPGTQAVLFDYGLTLVSFEFPAGCLLRMLERFRPRLAEALRRPAPPAATLLSEVLEPIEAALPGFGEDEIDYLAFYRQAWAAAGYDLPGELLYELLDAEQRCWDDAVRPAPDTFHVLHELADRGVKTAICSNAPFPPEMMRRQVRRNGIAERVDAVVFSSEIGRRKPAPEIYLAALERIAVPAEAALHVGDRVLEDYEAPRRLGMRAVICTALARSEPPPGVPTIASLAELDRLL